MARILVVEDEPPIGALIALYLQKDGHEVLAAEDGISALERFSRADPPIDLVVLDLMLPRLDGRGVCRRIRAESDVPVIMVTALDDPRDKLGGFDLGADDYVTKPFDPAELVARVRAILRRSSHTESEAETGSISVGNLAIDPDGRRVTASGRDIPLRVKEFDLLLELARNTGMVLERDLLLENVWGYQDADSRTLDVHISRLREKLVAGEATASIETVRSIGYRLVAS